MRYLRAGTARKRVLGPVLLAALFLALSDAADQIVQATSGSEPGIVFFPPLVARLLTPLAFLFGLARARLDHVGVGDLVRELDASGAETMQSALARALHDPGLRIGYRLDDRDEFVDSDARPLVLPAGGSEHAVTYVSRNGVQLAAIVHERALLEQPALVEAVTAAIRLALDNERLHAQLRNQLQELRASRTRLVRTADSERRRLERDLHDGAQQRLLALGLASTCFIRACRTTTRRSCSRRRRRSSRPRYASFESLPAASIRRSWPTRVSLRPRERSRAGARCPSR